MELVPDDHEQRLAARAKIQDQTDEDNAKTASAPPSQSAAASGVVTVSGVPIALTPDPRMTGPCPPGSTAFRPSAHPGPVAPSGQVKSAGAATVLVSSAGAAAAASSSAAAMPIPGQPRAIAFQYALSPITINGPPLDTTLVNASPTETTYPQLEWLINTTPLPQVVVPLLDSKTYQPNFPIEAAVGRFYRPDESPLAPAMMAIEGVARAASLDPKHPANNPTKHFLSFMVLSSQLLAWQHAQRFLENPLTYAETSKTLLYGYKAPSASGSAGAPATVRSMDDLQESGRRLLQKLCQRVDWLLELQRNSHRKFDGELALKVVVADRVWATETDAFIKEAEHKVVEMLQGNQQRFQQFREVSRRAVAWPHSPQLRVEIEAAGFAYRPTMIKRDRCVCDECAVEVNGWKPWHNPLAFHDFDKHKVRPPAQLFHAPNSPAVSQMVTDANRER